jgi:hypothetical protein
MCAVKCTKRNQTFLFRSSINHCSRCHVPIYRRSYIILWKDVLECTECGNIWVAVDLAEVEKWK